MNRMLHLDPQQALATLIAAPISHPYRQRKTDRHNLIAWS